MRSDRQLRLHRVLLVSAGAAYLAWWLFVHLALPRAFNPFLGRALVVATFGAVAAASYASRSIAVHLDAWLAVCCGIATAHYFYLFDDLSATNADSSLARPSGTAAGKCANTNDNAADFAVTNPSTPQNTTSPPTP